MFCQNCGTELHDGSRRVITIDGVQYFFCTTTLSVLSKDCANEYLLRLQRQRQELDSHVHAARSIH